MSTFKEYLEQVQDNNLTLNQIEDKINKVIKTGYKKFSIYKGDSSKAKETKYYNQLETRYIELIEKLINHKDFKNSGLDKEVYDINNFGEFVF